MFPVSDSSHLQYEYLSSRFIFRVPGRSVLDEYFAVL